MAEEEALDKTGIELFRELLRIYPVAELEDYYKGNIWRDEVMKVDLQLIESHRKEAGAPEPPPLEEVEVPELPKAPIFSGVVLPGPQAGGIVRPFGMPAAGMMAPAATPAAAPGGAVAELRLIALFVAKWKLDPAKTKMMLAKIAAPRRRYVIQNFKTDCEGATAMTALELYLEECEKTGEWGSATAVAVPGSTVTPPGTVRPVMPGTVRPVMPGTVRPTMPGTARPVMPVTVRPTMPGTVRPGMPGSVRPVMPRPVLGNATAPQVMSAGVKRPLTPTGVGAAIDPAKRPRIGPVGNTMLPKAVTPAARPAWGGATGPAWGQQAHAVGARPAAPKAISTRPNLATAIRPVAVARPVAPVRPVAAARPVQAKPQEKPGELIRNLLQRF